MRCSGYQPLNPRFFLPLLTFSKRKKDPWQKHFQPSHIFRLVGCPHPTTAFPLLLLLHAWLSYSFIDCATSIHLFSLTSSLAVPSPLLKSWVLASYCQVLVCLVANIQKIPRKRAFFSISWYNFPATPPRYNQSSGFFPTTSYSVDAHMHGLGIQVLD